MRIVLLFAAFIMLASCRRLPEFYTPAAARASAHVAAPGELSHFAAMDSPDAANHIVSGILNNTEGSWRWCMKRAELQFSVPAVNRLRLKADITVAELTFPQTGPVKIEVAIDGRVLDTIRYDKPEGRTFEVEVPDGLLTAGKPVHVVLTADKEWIAPDTGEHRGFILTSAGFVQ
jgi:hypothetical protein